MPVSAVRRVNGEHITIQYEAIGRGAPPIDAPGTDVRLIDCGRLGLFLPEDATHVLGANADSGDEIVLVDSGSETRCVFVMAIDGNSEFDAYLWIEPDAYNEWDHGL